MTRKFTELATPSAREHLQELLASVSDPLRYRKEMRALGEELGRALLSRMAIEDREDSGVLIACTVEDADWLTSGVLEELSGALSSERISLACFWNHREVTGEANPTKTARIVKRYVEDLDADEVGTVVVTKSIISGACVVRTNLMEVLSFVSPSRVFVVAPVMHTDAPGKLASEFPPDVSDLFSYVYFAEDSERDTDTGEIRPGIGGEVYQLLGFSGQDDKNRLRPDLVKHRSA